VSREQVDVAAPGAVDAGVVRQQTHPLAAHQVQRVGE